MTTERISPEEAIELIKAHDGAIVLRATKAISGLTNRVVKAGETLKFISAKHFALNGDGVNFLMSGGLVLEELLDIPEPVEISEEDRAAAEAADEMAAAEAMEELSGLQDDGSVADELPEESMDDAPQDDLEVFDESE